MRRRFLGKSMISPIAMVLSDSLCMCVVCVSVTFVRTGRIMATIKNVENYVYRIECLP